MRNFVLFLVVCTLCLALGEMVVRIALPQPGFSAFPPNQPIDLLQANPTRSYSYNPGFAGDMEERSGSINVSINSLGMRDAELAAGEPIDILAIGDSFTAGAMVEQNEAWPAQLQQQLNVASERPLRVLNAGVSGYNMQQIRIAGTELLALKPGALVVGAYPSVSSRLWNPYVWFDGYAVRESKRDRLALTSTGFLLATDNPWLSTGAQMWLFKNFHLGGWLWLLLAPAVETPYGPRPSGAELTAWFMDELDQLNNAARAANIPMIVFVLAHQGADGKILPAAAGYNQAVVDYCVANNIPVFDTYPLLAQYPTEGVEFRAGGDDFHWSPLGHAVAAKGLADYMIGAGLLPEQVE